MKINRIQIKSAFAKIAFCLFAFFIQLNVLQAQKTSSATSKLMYAAADIHDGETKSISYNTPVIFESAFTKTNGPFSEYTQSWNEKYKKNDTAQAIVLNPNSVINISTLSNYHKHHTFKCSVKGVSSLHEHNAKEKVTEEKSERKTGKHKMRLNLSKDIRLIN